MVDLEKFTRYDMILDGSITSYELVRHFNKGF
jgi:hypothetical protein